MSARTIVVVAAVIIRDDRVLVTQRLAGAHLAGYWEFPGGKLDDGESPEEALGRELREELALEVTVGDILDVTFWRYEQKNVLLLFYRASIARGEPQDLGVAAHQWAALDTLDALTFPPADLDVLEKVRTILGARRRTA